MTAGVPGSPREARPGHNETPTHMSNSNRGEKRGVLGTGRAKKLDKTKDAGADADDNDADEQGGG